MKFLILSNLYPPQELGGYGRSMADFAWGLTQLGHHIHVITSDTRQLGPSALKGASGEQINRDLELKGSYEGGVKQITNEDVLHRINAKNAETIERFWQVKGPFDGVLVGNLDLLGVEALEPLLSKDVPVVHHIGFVYPPFHPVQEPTQTTYQIVGASQAVRRSLEKAGLGYGKRKAGTSEIPVVYPGVRNDLFGITATGRVLPAPLDGSEKNQPLGNKQRPLKVCFAGLLMGSKGAHTLVEAMVLLKQRGIVVEGHIAGESFQPGYRERLEKLLEHHKLEGVRFTGQLSRASLARCFRLHHVCVFPSIQPEAFGIVGAEAMASGIVLVSSGIGGAEELIKDSESGLFFKPGDSEDLANKLEFLTQNPTIMAELAKNGESRSRKLLSVVESARQLEALLTDKDQHEMKTLQVF